MPRLSELLFGVIVCSAAATAGCAAQKGAESPIATITNPLAPSDARAALPGQTSTGFTVTVTDGWTGAVVEGARVSAGDAQVVTGADGTFHVTTDGKCLVLEVLADGFLDRRTCAKPSVTLWPVSNDAEVDATRTTAFHYSDRLTDQAAYALDYGVLLTPEIREHPGVEAVWAAAAAQIKQATHDRLAIPLVPSLSDEGYLVSVATQSPRCGGWFTWNFSVAGFCWMSTAQYFLTNIAVDPAAVGRSDVALRALLYSYALHEHPLPGLMNAIEPAAELSPFERKTLHMMSLRWGKEVRWPDFDKVP